MLLLYGSLTKEYFAWLKTAPKLGRTILSGSIFAPLDLTVQITKTKKSGLEKLH